MEPCHPHYSDRPISVTLTWKLPGEHAHRFVSRVILDPAKLTVKIKSCFECQASSLVEPLNGLKWEGKELVITDIHLPRGKPPRKSCKGQLGKRGPFAQSLRKLHLEAVTFIECRARRPSLNP